MLHARGNPWRGIRGPTAAKRRNPHQSGRISRIVRLQAAAVHHLSSASSARGDLSRSRPSLAPLVTRNHARRVMTAVDLKIPALSYYTSNMRTIDIGRLWIQFALKVSDLLKRNLGARSNLVVEIKLTSLFIPSRRSCIHIHARLSNRIGVT